MRKKVPGTEPTMALPSKGMYLLLRTIVLLGCLVSFLHAVLPTY